MELGFGRKVTLEKAVAPHSSTLAWKISWMEEPGRLQSIGLLRVGHDWATSLSLFTFPALEKEMATHSSVLAWRIPETGSLVGCRLRGRRVRHDWNDLAAAAAATVEYSVWGSFHNLSALCFLHLQNGDNNTTYLIRWLQIFDMISDKALRRVLDWSLCSICTSF